MDNDTEALFRQRLRRYVTALRNEKPDCVPIRPFVAEFVAKYAGMTCQEVTHDYNKAFEATRLCAKDFDWDAVVANMVYVWTGLTHTLGLKYYATPGIDLDPDTGFQYREPPPEQAWMPPEDYDAFIDDPTAYLFTTWLPRVSRHIEAPGRPVTLRNQFALVNGAMAMLSYFNAFGPQVEALRVECGMPSAIAGILKAPFDILADKFRGYVGLAYDLFERPEKVMKACEALMPHLLHIARTTADPDRLAPIGFWMHRGCVPFVSRETFDRFYWPTLKPIIEELWADGHQVLFYAEGDWNAHLDRFAELPDRSIVYHVDKADIGEVQKVLGHKFCISGGVPNDVLAFGTPEDVRRHCRRVLDVAARDGGYIMDASAIIQNDARVENIRAMTEFTREYGVYDGAAYTPEDTPVEPPGRPGAESGESGRLLSPRADARPPGVCVPWEDEAAHLPEITGDPDLIQRIWEANDSFGYMFAWQCVLSF